jgi:drug/metabolite transporter (DMT)-like permease
VWNLLLAGARDSHAFAVIVLLVGAIVGAPVAVFFWDFHAAVWPFLIASSALELAYFGLLAFAYTHAELSVVYPLARGLAPVLVLAGAVAFTGADTTPRQVSGVVLVGTGIMLVRGVRGGRGAWLAIVIGCVIASYTVVDKHGVAHASPVSYLELMTIFTGVAYASIFVAFRGSGVLVATALAAVFLHERVTPWRAAGAALVVAGVALLSV